MEKMSVKHKALECRDSVVQGHLNYIAQQGVSYAGRPPPHGQHLQQTNQNGAENR